MDIPVSNNQENMQFEVHEHGETALLQYRFLDGMIWLMHTEVPKNLEGKGYRIRPGTIRTRMGHCKP